MNGSARYAADYREEGMLYGKLVRSPHAHARVLDIKLPVLPDGYFAVDQRDVPGVNQAHVVMDDSPVFAGDTVEYVGDPVLMIVGPDEKETNRLAAKTEVLYEKLPAILNVRNYETEFFTYGYSNGDTPKAFANADRIFEEEFETGYQEHAYLETQGLVAQLKGEVMIVRGSMQCPYYMHTAVVKALGFSPDKVRIIQDTTGGGFGGKEGFPSILACQVAVAAHKACGRPVRVIFSRREDMEFSSKRHPSVCTYKAAVKDGRITGMEVAILLNAGGFTTMSSPVLQRSTIAAAGVYTIENLKVHGRAVKTNTIPTGAFRGFGAPQVFFAIEMFMSHIAGELGMEPMAFKEQYLAKQGDPTSTNGKYHFPVPLQEMIKEVDAVSAYRKKRAAYNQVQSGRYRKGIGMGIWFHGAGFTGSGERDFVKAVAQLHKHPDGRVELLASLSDMGQGLKTTLCKIVANEMSLPLDRVFLDNADTGRMPNSGPTAASRSLMIVGELLRRAAINLRSCWKDGEDQIVEEHFKEPDFVIPFNPDTFQGDAYPTFAWAVAVVELRLDLLTGKNEVTGAWGNFDVGTPIDTNIVIGQMEGGFMQGLGYASMEQLSIDPAGHLRNISLSDYTIPTAKDIPVMQVLLHVEEYPQGPYGAKGAGELPTVGPAPAYIEALEQALGNVPIFHIPFSQEDTIQLLLERERKEAV
jgi:CO/xanthine dehydrogenase Mo-binding subunit